MNSIYERLFDSLISRIDPERAHAMALQALAIAQSLPGGLTPLRAMAAPPDPRLAVRLWGLSFANPLGVAAGLDKNGEAIEALLALGFGHVEAGTVTVRPQQGNPRPRMWRLAEQHAVVNALGFPSHGSASVLKRLQRLATDGHRPGIVGLNIGKNRDTPLELAADDYCTLVTRFAREVDFLTVNVSSPNTPGLRDLQLAEQLSQLLRRVRAANREAGGERPPPLLLKLSPDLDDDRLREIADIACEHHVDGIVATNTTTDRSGLPAEHRALEGGLSGAPLRHRANEVTRLLYRQLEGRIPIVGVGGVASAAEVVERMQSGASLVQIYTGFIYAGPALPGAILRELTDEIDRRGCSSIAQIVGSQA